MAQLYVIYPEIYLLIDSHSKLLWVWLFLWISLVSIFLYWILLILTPLSL